LSGGPPLPLDEARRRLKELGYLEGGAERFAFRRAFEGRGGLFLPAVLLGAFAAALASAAAVEACEAGFGESPVSLAALGAHLFAADLAPAALSALLLSAAADRSRSPGRAGTFAALGVACVVFALWAGGIFALARGFSPRGLLWAPALVAAALAAAVWTRAGFLARAYAHSRVLPAHPRRRLALAGVGIGLAASFGVLLLRREPAPVDPPRPSPRPHAVVVVAADGLEGDEAASVVRAASPSPASEGWWPAEPASPPELWTDLATGVSPERHGVRALERVRPAGSAIALRPPLGTFWYLKRLGPALGLVASAPVSAADRRAAAFWEIAASAGLPSLAVGWWAAGPWPGAVVVGNEEVLAGARDGVEANRESWRLFRERARGGERVRTVYLPGLDILRRDPARRRIARDELEAAIRAEASAARDHGDVLVLLAAGSHATTGALQRMAVFDPGGKPVTVRIRPEDVAPSILARAGVQPARDLPGRPASALFAPGTLEETSVATYGPRLPPAEPRTRPPDGDYLRKLKSLGYLD
jgi:hypothetical protein